jgi:hypothetical protein
MDTFVTAPSCRLSQALPWNVMVSAPGSYDQPLAGFCGTRCPSNYA